MKPVNMLTIMITDFKTQEMELLYRMLGIMVGMQGQPSTAVPVRSSGTVLHI
jgi:hypothetical protein